MLPYGGTPVCPKCSKSVYAAEQAMGPGRKLYHKFCLTCASCNKRLDPGSLVEHNEEPYCKNCHTKSFGTKDLRSANLPHREESLLPQNTGASRSPPASPTRNAPLSPQFTGSFWSTAPVGRQMRGSNGSYTVGARAGRGNGGLVLQPTRSLGSMSSPIASPTTSSPPLPAEADAPVPARGVLPSTGLEQVMEDAEDETDNEDAAVDRLLGSPTQMRSPSPEQPSNAIKRLSQSRLPTSPIQTMSTGPPRTPFFNSSTVGRGGNGFSPHNGDGDSGMSPLVATPTGTRYGRALDGGMGGPVKSHTTGTPSRWGAQTPSCSKCGKSVFFAEQVKAIGKLWHRGCLRCTQCNTSLATGRVNEHNEAPYCARCYTKVHGPAGSGYALLGKAGG